MKSPNFAYGLTFNVRSCIGGVLCRYLATPVGEIETKGIGLFPYPKCVVYLDL